MFMRLDFSSKFTSPTSMLGPVATLAAEGTEKSRRVFPAMVPLMVLGKLVHLSTARSEEG